VVTLPTNLGHVYDYAMWLCSERNLTPIRVKISAFKIIDISYIPGFPANPLNPISRNLSTTCCHTLLIDAMPIDFQDLNNPGMCQPRAFALDEIYLEQKTQIQMRSIYSLNSKTEDSIMCHCSWKLGVWYLVLEPLVPWLLDIQDFHQSSAFSLLSV